MVELLQQYEDKAPRFAVLVFFIFGILWLIFAGLSASGVGLAEDAGVLGLLQGVCAMVATAVLAARLRRARQIAGIAAALIVLAPLLLSDLRFQLARGQGDRQFVAAFAQDLAQPPHARALKRDVMKNFYAAGYTEPAELVRIEEAHLQRIKDWLRNAAKFAAARAEAFRNTRFKELSHTAAGGLADDEMKRRVIKCIFETEGADWPWFRAFVSAARKDGFPEKAPELTAEEKETVRAHAEDWAWANLSTARRLASGFDQGTAELEEHHRHRADRSYSVALGAFWIAALAMTAAWIGRAAYTREFDAAQFPGWVRAGLAALLRKDSTAWLRIAGGLLVMVLAAGAATGLALSGVRTSRGLAKALAAAMLAGGALVFSGLSLSEGSGPVRFPPMN